ncbi:hypothetical protein GcC1_005032 [Golovinomyces cichoracearum]|uniref:DDE-1 domain-containing protein n=1 Tax=Golovinomyces cichoracearum TaxID=62708 RepID=A0A420J8X2_9PEZI|nr:hypothetical protein GcC1_005032 [Golovinomyces cichoracearum]
MDGLTNFQKNRTFECYKTHDDSGLANAEVIDAALPGLRRSLNMLGELCTIWMKLACFNSMAPRTTATDRVEGLTADKHWVTIADGSDKYEPFFIRYLKLPRCVRRKSANWDSMTKARIKLGCLRSFSSAPSRVFGKNVALENIDIEFLSPNQTSKLQPMDGRILASFRWYYLFYRLSGAVNQDQVGLPDVSKVDAKTTLKWSPLAWNFNHPGFLGPEILTAADEYGEAVLQDVSGALEQLQLAPMSINSLLNPFDDKRPCHIEITGEVRVAAVVKSEVV